jgi:hypothetical protein
VVESDQGALVYQWSCNRADAVITVSLSSSATSFVLRYAAERIHVIPMGVDDVFDLSRIRALAARRQCYFADGRLCSVRRQVLCTTPRARSVGSFRKSDEPA